jgi:hypothetical protein
MPSFLDQIETAKKQFEKIEKDFRAELEKPEWKETIEREKKKREERISAPYQPPQKTWDQALLTPEAGLLLGLAVVGVYIWMSRR